MSTSPSGNHERVTGEKLDAAERQLAECEEKWGRQSLELLPVLDQLGRLYLCVGLFAKSELIYKRVLDIVNSNGANAADVIDCLFKLGLIYRTQGKFDDAESVYLQGLGMCDADNLNKEDKAVYAERLCCLAGLSCEKKEFQQAEQLLLKAAKFHQEINGASSYYSRLISMGLASTCRKIGKLGDADEFAARALVAGSGDEKEASGATVKDGTNDRQEIIRLAHLYYSQGRYADVDLLLSSELFTNTQRFWPDHPQVCQALHDRAELFRAQGQFDQADKAFRASLQLRSQLPVNAYAELGATAMSLGAMLLAQNKFDAAEPVLKLALKSRVRAFGVEHPCVAACVETISVLLKRTKRNAIAQKLDARARDIRTKLVWQSERAAAGAARAVSSAG